MNAIISTSFFKLPLKQLLMLSLCILNLIYMHYYIFLTCDIEAECDTTSFFDNICGIVFDMAVLFVLFCLATQKRPKPCFALCFAATWMWSFCNVLYSRFFFRYISFSAIGQSSNLFDWFMLQCMVDELRVSDLYFVVSLIAFCIIYRSAPSDKFGKPYRKTALIIGAFLLLNLASHAIYCLSRPTMRYVSYYQYRLFFTHFDTNRNMGRPNWTNFHRGSIRTIIPDLVNEVRGTRQLNKRQKATIEKEIRDTRLRVTTNEVNPNIKNIIFILVESYTAFTTDMKIDGKEVTPFLNRMRHSPGVYYNGNMKSNITIGQSSDGQFIYMSGLLPLRSIITVSKAKNIEIPAMPKMMRVFNNQIETRMVIPTLPTMWEQDAMCKAYGFDHLYTSNDYKKENVRNLNDLQVFELAASLDKKSRKPFFSYILTMSMHGPYTKQIDDSFIIKSKDFYPEFINFLNICHYTDKCIENYFAHLKKNNLYDNSLIIIAPDHQVPENTLNTEQYGITRELPLFIINGNINSKDAWHGACNQLDIYTTLLDLLNINTPYLGLGNSLLQPDYTNSVSDDKWDISEWIILSNYFDYSTK